MLSITSFKDRVKALEYGLECPDFQQFEILKPGFTSGFGHKCNNKGF